MIFIYDTLENPCITNGLELVMLKPAHREDNGIFTAFTVLFRQSGFFYYYQV